MSVARGLAGIDRESLRLTDILRPTGLGDASVEDVTFFSFSLFNLP